MPANLSKAYATGIVAFVVIGAASFFVMALILAATAPDRAVLGEGVVGLNPAVKSACRIVAAALFGILVGEYSGVRSFRTEAAKAVAQVSDETNQEPLPLAASPSRVRNWLRLVAWALVVVGVMLSL
jgi:hypothetical protein